MLYETVMGWMAAQKNEGIAIGEKQGEKRGFDKGMTQGFDRGSRDTKLQTARRAMNIALPPPLNVH